MPAELNYWRSVVQITVNGESREVAAGTTISDLLGTLELDSRFLAVERNRELVPRCEHAACEIREQDEIEIVTLVGGG